MKALFNTRKAEVEQPAIVPATPEFIRERMNVVLENAVKELRLLHTLANDSECFHTAEFLLSTANHIHGKTGLTFFVSMDNRARESA